MGMTGLITFINLIIVLVFLGIWIYGLILFIKLANKGIKALDIYINENTNDK